MSHGSLKDTATYRNPGRSPAWVLGTNLAYFALFNANRPGACPY